MATNSSRQDGYLVALARDGAQSARDLSRRVEDGGLEGVLDEGDHWERGGELPDAAVRRFGELAGEAAQPIDDVRGTADYRRHAVSVMARRTLRWAWDAR